MTDSTAATKEEVDTPAAGEPTAGSVGEDAASQTASDDAQGAAGESDWRDEEIARLRRENAQRRTQNAELKARLEGAKTLEEFQAAQAEWDKKVADLEEALEGERRVALLERVKGATGLDDKKVARLQGATYEELVADATEVFGDVKPAVETFAPEPTGGLRPSSERPTADPKEIADAYLESKYGR